MKTTTKPALLYRLGNAWKCETPGIGHHAGGDSEIFRTLKEARAYAHKNGYRTCRFYAADADGPEYQFDPGILAP
jgi:hypothetical protein